jgi:Protein of unknown function (DUF3761)
MEQQTPSTKPGWIYRHKALASLLAGGLVLIGAGLTNHTPITAVKGAAVSIAPSATPTQPSSTPTPLPTITPVPPTPTITPAPIEETQTAPVQQPGLSNNNYYENSSGNEVHSPAYSNDNSAPAGATAQCGDGTYSFSQHHSGTCSHHGGVAQWL